MTPVPTFRRLLARGLLLATLAPPAGVLAAPAELPVDPAAIGELVSAVSLDMMSESALQACVDMGVPSADAMRGAWAAWRERQQVAVLRQVLTDLSRRLGRKAPSWNTLTEAMRQRVLADPQPEAACAALAQDWQAPSMDVAALYPRARSAAASLVQAGLVSRPELPAVAVGAVQGQVLLPSQLPALSASLDGGWGTLSAAISRREHGAVLVRGLVERWSREPDRFRLILRQGGRRSAQHIYLAFDAEAWVGREVVLRGVLTSLRDYAADLAEAELVRDGPGLTPSPLPQAPLVREEVLLQRVTTPPGRGLKPQDLAAVVLHGEGSYANGSSWKEDVRFLLRDGSCYARTEMPPDQLDVAASRRLEPQRWCRWRATAKGYEMQDQDDDGRPRGEWRAVAHRPMKAWPAGPRLDGSFSRSRYDGSLALGGVASIRGLRLSADGRFEWRLRSQGGSGSMAAAVNGTAISASTRADGRGSSSTMAGSVGGAGGTVGVASGSRQDDGASRRGRYQFEGFAVTLLYDDGHQERLLSFPTDERQRGVYVGSGSLVLDN